MKWHHIGTHQTRAPGQCLGKMDAIHGPYCHASPAPVQARNPPDSATWFYVPETPVKWIPLYPIIWSSWYFNILYMLFYYYVVPFHVIPLFDRPIHLFRYLPILSFISPTSSCYYVVIPSFVPLLFWCPIDVLLEIKGCKTFTGIKISFWTRQRIYQYSSSCRFTYLTSSMKFCPDNQCLYWFSAGCIRILNITH